MDERTPETFGQRLQLLITTVPRRDGGRYTHQEIADALGVSRPTINSWLQDQVQPRLNQLQGLASLFDVGVEYLVGSEGSTATAEQLQMLAALRHAGVQSLALRAGELTPQNRQFLQDTAQHLLRLQRPQDADAGEAPEQEQ